MEEGANKILRGQLIFKLLIIFFERKRKRGECFKSTPLQKLELFA